MQGCNRLIELGLWDSKNCCGSCHEDSSELNIEACSLVMPTGEELEVCCKPWEEFYGKHVTYPNGRLVFPAAPVYQLTSDGKELT